MSYFKINSKEYWDYRFETDWEDMCGREQTSYFTKLAIELFPESFKKIIRENSLSILDWGCAEGDGTHLLSKEFTTSKVVGLDISQTAVSKAKTNYPENTFLGGTLQKYNQKYDIIFSSNCLEHFKNPQQVINELMEYTNHFLVLLLPFQEFKRIEEHFYTFDYNSFDFRIKDFFLVFHAVINTSLDKPVYWPGKQIFLIYVNNNSSLLDNVNLYFYKGEIEKWNNTVDELKKEVETLTCLLRLKDDKIEYFSRQFVQKTEEVEQKSNELQQKEQEIKQKEEEIKRKEEEINQKEQEIKQKDQVIKSLQNEVRFKESQIEMIYSTRTFRLATKIWRIKQFFLTAGAKFLPKAVKTIIKKFYHPYIQPENTVNTDTFSYSTDEIENGPTKYDIICFPVIDWDLRYQRPQQLIHQFAQNGHRAFYLTTYFAISNNCEDKLSKLYKIKNIEENVYEVTLVSNSKINIYKDKIDEKNIHVFKEAINQLRYDFDITDAVCIVDLPFWYPLVAALKKEQAWKIVYDCMDQHKGFSTNDNLMLSQEKELSQNADLVVVTAQKLFEEQKRLNSNCIIIPNAADFEHFNAPKVNDLLSEIPRPIIGYFGAISDWFDVDLVSFLAQQRPQYSFVLIGSTFGSNVRPLEKRNNVYLLGEKPYQELPSYLYWFDVCIIPFKLNILTEATNPVKFFEYVSAGKPVVSVKLPELIPYSEYLYIADNQNEFLRQIDLALTEDPSLREPRVELARQNTWQKRFGQFSESIKQLHPKVSIIIVTFNNLFLTKLCVDSIFTKSRYPNFEIIIVDNLSIDGTREYLQDLAAAHNNVKIILNQDNAGFAKANNQGLKIAEGEYIILLNNDTVVTHGWISKLLRYLRDPAVGMVGPVTNSCGNEAKIDVDYEELKDMDRFARDYMKEHEGLFFEIKMLAMFCVAFRRSLIDEIGLLDERFGIGMFEDDDYSQRIKAKGYKIICAEDIFIHHFGGASFQKLPREEYMQIFEDNRKKFEEKWDEKWEPHKYRD